MKTDYLDVTGKSQFDGNIVKMTNHSYIPHNSLAINNSNETRARINH